MARPRITITKLFVKDAQGRFRYYSPHYDPSLPKNVPRAKADTLDLEGNNPRYENISYIKTEKELCWLIYNRYGAGIYRVIGHVMGRHGTFTFWRGEVNSEGFVFYKRDTKSNEVRKLEKEFQNASSEEEKNLIQEEINIEKEMSQMSGAVRYGFSPFLKPSSYRGEMVLWTSPEMYIEKEEAREQFNESNMNDDFNLVPINSFQREEDDIENDSKGGNW